MKNLVLFLLLVCTLHGSCVSLECYKCTFSDEGCQDLSISAPPGFETCPDGSVCHVRQTTLANGEVVDASRGCIPDSDCFNGCSGFLSESQECTSCCNEDRCNSDVPYYGDVSCYDCYNIPILGTTACGEPFNPRDAKVQTTTCSHGKCAVYFLNETSTKTVLQRGCPLTEYLCMSDKTQCMEDMCMDCCSGNLCNGPPTVRSANNNGQNAGNNGQATNRDSNGFNMLVMSLASILLMIGS